MPRGPQDATAYLGYSGTNGEPASTALRVPAGAGYGQNITFYKTPDAYSYVRGLPEDQVKALQLRLVAAGYAPKSGLTAGVWNKDSASSLARAMADSNAAGGIGVDAMLNKASQPGGQVGGAGGGGGGGGASVGPEKRAVEKPNLVTGGHTIELTAPQDIEKAAGDTFNKLLGRNIHADETLQLVQQLQNLDRLNQATKFGQEDTVKGAGFMQDMATAQQRQAEANASADQSLALHQQAANASAGPGSGPTTIIPGANTSGMPIGGFQAKLPNAETTAPANPAAYAEWVIKTQMPNAYLGAQMAERARQMGDFIAQKTAPEGGPLTRTRV